MGERAFTMLELAVVLVLVGAIVSIVGFSLVGPYRSWAVRSSADEFASAHELTRSVATWQGRTVELHIDAEEGRFWLEADTDPSTPENEIVGPVRSVKPTVGLTIEPTGRDVLCFDARGLPSLAPPCDPGNVTVRFDSDTEVATLRITPLGKLLR